MGRGIGTWLPREVNEKAWFDKGNSGSPDAIGGQLSAPGQEETHTLHKNGPPRRQCRGRQIKTYLNFILTISDSPHIAHSNVRRSWSSSDAGSMREQYRFDFDYEREQDDGKGL